MKRKNYKKIGKMAVSCSEHHVYSLWMAQRQRDWFENRHVSKARFHKPLRNNGHCVHESAVQLRWGSCTVCLLASRQFARNNGSNYGLPLVVNRMSPETCIAVSFTRMLYLVLLYPRRYRRK